MSKPLSWSIFATAVGLVSGASLVLAEEGIKIENNDSVYIDGQAFKVMPGKAKGDVATQIKSLGARELGPGAIIFRSGEKLYIVDGVAAVVQEGRAEPSYMRDPAYGPRRDVLINNPNWQPPSYMRDPAYAQRRVPIYDEPEYMRFQNRDVN